MSVYKPSATPHFHYDFVVKGRRFHGSTGTKTRRAAEAFEDRIRREVAEGKHGAASQLTLDQAAWKWFREVGSKQGEADRIEQRLELLLAIMDKTLRLHEIGTPHVSEAIQARAAIGFTKSAAEDAQIYYPKNATINRDTIATLRPILNRARTHWGAEGLPVINWSELTLETPAEHVQYYTRAHRQAWRAQCGPTTGLFLELLLTYGPRLGELFFPPEAYDPDGPRLVIKASRPGRKSRKADVPHTIRLLDRHAREIAARVGRAQAADPPLPHIWYLEDVDPVSDKTTLVPLTYYGMQSRLRTAARNAGVTTERLIHGARHHAGTDFLRSSKNLKLTQRLLGHKDIKSTMRYAHALDDDLMTALEEQDEAATTPLAPDKTDRKVRTK